MNDNVISFEEALQNAKDCEHEEKCPHCEFIDNATDNFIKRVSNLSVKSEAFREEVETLIEYVQAQTERETLAEVGYSLLQESGVLDDEDD